MVTIIITIALLIAVVASALLFDVLEEKWNIFWSAANFKREQPMVATVAAARHTAGYMDGSY